MSSRRSSGSRVAARARARERRILLDAERAVRDEAIEEAGSQFFTLSDERDKLLDKVAEVEAQMGAPIRALFDLGESQRRVAQLLEITAEEVRQLRDAAVLAQPDDGAVDARA